MPATRIAAAGTMMNKFVTLSTGITRLKIADAAIITYTSNAKKFPI